MQLSCHIQQCSFSSNNVPIEAWGLCSSCCHHVVKWWRCLRFHLEHNYLLNISTQSVLHKIWMSCVQKWETGIYMHCEFSWLIDQWSGEQSLKWNEWSYNRMLYIMVCTAPYLRHQNKNSLYKQGQVGPTVTSDPILDKQLVDLYCCIKNRSTVWIFRSQYGAWCRNFSCHFI